MTSATSAGDALNAVLGKIEKLLPMMREMERKVAAINDVYKAGGSEPIAFAAAATLEEIHAGLSNVKKNETRWSPKVSLSTETPPA